MAKELLTSEEYQALKDIKAQTSTLLGPSVLPQHKLKLIRFGLVSETSLGGAFLTVKGEQRLKNGP
jgi:hypothetical protein